MSEFTKGQVITTSEELRKTAPGTKLINTATDVIKTRNSNGTWFVEGGHGWGDQEWIVLSLPEAPPAPDLSNREDLALELFRIKNDKPGETHLGIYASSYKRLADWVLEHFQSGPLKVGDKVKVTKANHHRFGHVGTIDNSLDEDDDYGVSWDDGGWSYVNKDAVQRV